MHNSVTKITFLFLLLTSSVWAQSSDTDSIRWQRIFPSEINQSLFDFRGMNDSTLFGSIWRSAYYGESIFFLESDNISDKTHQYFELLKFPKTDRLEIDSCITFTWNYYEYELSNSIVYAFKDNNPFTDKFGDPIIVDCGGGALCFTYPFKTYVLTPIDRIKEIRIKEGHVFNEATNSFEYQPIAVQLTPQRVGLLRSSIWVDLAKMREKNPKIENQDWYQFIVQRNYRGDQYMQLKTKGE